MFRGRAGLGEGAGEGSLSPLGWDRLTGAPECSGGIPLMKSLVKRLSFSVLFILSTFVEYLLCARPCVTYENTVTQKTWLLL